MEALTSSFESLNWMHFLPINVNRSVSCSGPVCAESEALQDTSLFQTIPVFKTGNLIKGRFTIK